MAKILLCLCFFSSLICEDHLQELETNGFTLVQNVFSKEELTLLAGQFQAAKDKAFHIIHTIPPKPRFFKENNSDTTSFYWKTDHELILQGGEGRYEFYQGFQEGVFDSELVLHNSILETLMRHTMVDEFTNYAGVIHSEPGSADQYWHRDTNTLANVGTDGSKLVLMDDFYFTVLIPIIVPFTLENGATEFVAGSHRLASSNFDPCKKVQVEAPLGSALVFNGKINHRGRANKSAEARPALYLVYHKKWYNDQYRYGIPYTANR